MRAKVDVIKTRTKLHEIQKKIDKDFLPFDENAMYYKADLIELEHNLWQSDDKIREIAAELGLFESLEWC